MPTIAELMRPDVPLLSAQCTLEEASRAFERSGIESLPLCDPQGVLLGIVDRSDISRAFKALGELANSLRAQHLMHPDAPSIGIHDTVEKAMAEMGIHQTRYLPVLAGSTVQGMLTSADIAHAGPRVRIEELIEHVSFPEDRSISTPRAS
ncbi:CBS domain-containing protein [Nesterenkonia sp. Act20]|uniref:CBS domain-containing protein n=1 Tax=Nesterenkonia sp. Act20 TaxID=1483432 RepID=UPI001C448C16|nr:CBS domain-containing protein [Nesterenkonia sp. Act20]